MKKTSTQMLIINPGSTTTKLAIYDGLKECVSHCISHTSEDVTQYACVWDQLPMRLSCIRNFLRSQPSLPPCSLVMGRGGLLHPIESGIYSVNQHMLEDLQKARYGEHASNLGAPLAHHFARQYGCKAYIVDPVVVDEMNPEARISGHPLIERKSIFHALNHKYVGREAAKQLGKSYEEAHLIIGHLGGGISIASHKKGRVIDVNNALDGDGPFSPERSGSLPVGDLCSIAFTEGNTLSSMKRMITGQGGLSAYRGNNDVKKLIEAAQHGELQAKNLLNAFVYQIAKEIASHVAVLEGEVDAIVLTGGIAHSDLIIHMIKQRISSIAPILVFPGEKEMHSLAENGYALLLETREVKTYVS